MKPFGARRQSPVVPAAGERVLAWAEAEQGPVGGTRDALYLPGPSGGAPRRIAWHEIETADWDLETGVLFVREVGTYGAPRPEHRLALAEPGLLLQLLRERVTASIVMTRFVPIQGKRGIKVIGRRASSGDRAVAWFVDYDAAIDPEDPFVAVAVAEALADAHAEVGQ